MIVQSCCSYRKNKFHDGLYKFMREKLLVRTTAGSREMLPGRFELTPTHGQVHIPMSTKASEMCLHATPTVSRAAFNDQHMLTFWLLSAQMEPTDEQIC